MLEYRVVTLLNAVLLYLAFLCPKHKVLAGFYVDKTQCDLFVFALLLS